LWPIEPPASPVETDLALEGKAIPVGSRVVEEGLHPDFEPLSFGDLRIQSIPQRE